MGNFNLKTRLADVKRIVPNRKLLSILQERHTRSLFDPSHAITMCKKATCDTCQKTTWRGCGNHIPTVMDSIPEEERCVCEPKVEVDGKKYPPKAKRSLSCIINHHDGVCEDVCLQGGSEIGSV